MISLGDVPALSSFELSSKDGVILYICAESKGPRFVVEELNVTDRVREYFERAAIIQYHKE